MMTPLHADNVDISTDHMAPTLLRAPVQALDWSTRSAVAFSLESWEAEWHMFHKENLWEEAFDAYRFDFGTWTNVARRQGAPFCFIFEELLSYPLSSDRFACSLLPASFWSESLLHSLASCRQQPIRISHACAARLDSVGLWVIVSDMCYSIASSQPLSMQVRVLNLEEPSDT